MRCAGAPLAWPKAAKQFRKVNGFLHLPVLRKALEAEVARITVNPPEYDQEVA